MLTEAQQAWLVEAKPETISALFKSIRSERLESLNTSKVSYENGKLVQDEVAALHRLENHFLSLRKQALGQEK